MSNINFKHNGLATGYKLVSKWGWFVSVLAFVITLCSCSLCSNFLPLNLLTSSPNPSALHAPLPSCCCSWERLPGRDKSSVWDQLEDAAMETFSLSRANLLPLAFFLCVWGCIHCSLRVAVVWCGGLLLSVRTCLFTRDSSHEPAVHVWFPFITVAIKHFISALTSHFTQFPV